MSAADPDRTTLLSIDTTVDGLPVGVFSNRQPTGTYTQVKLRSDGELERSAVVANCRMNRERNLLGSNGYDRELGFDPVVFLKARTEGDRAVAWLDLCCGTGRALSQAAEMIQAQGLPIRIVGVDLVGMFDAVASPFSGLRLIEASLSTWRPEMAFDLITCVHGLHYIGDKLGLIERATSWLVKDGLFVASLDVHNLKINGHSSARKITSLLRNAGLQHDSQRRRISCQGQRLLNIAYRYLGADDTAGPNFTGQPAVDSHYEFVDEFRS